MKKIIGAFAFLFLLSGCSGEDVGADSDNDSSASIVEAESESVSIVERGDAEETIEYISKEYNIEVPSPTTEDAGDGLANRWNFNNEILVYGNIETNEIIAVMFTKMTKEELFDYMENGENVPISTGLKEMIEKDEPFSVYETTHRDKQYKVEIFPYKDSETGEYIDNYRLAILP